MYIKTDLVGIKINHLQRITEKKIQEAAERLSTGLRINSAKDDAAGLQISTRLTSKVNELKKGLQNIKDGISFLETADGKLAIVLEHLQRAKELSIKAQNDTYSSKDIQAIQQEFNSIKSSIDQIINSSTFNNKEIFSSGNGIYINNGNSAVKVNYDSSLYPPTFTVSIWVKMDESTKGRYATPLMARDEKNLGGGLWNLYGFNFYKTPDDKWEFRIGPGDNVPTWSVLKTNKLEYNKWTHLTGSYDGSVMKFYVDGKLIGSRNTPYVPAQTNGYLIGNSNWFSYPGNVVDNLRVYNRALTDEEVKQLHDGMPPKDGKIGEWLFEEKSGSTAYDSSVNTNDGTLINGATRIGTFSETYIRSGSEPNSVLNLRLEYLSSDILGLNSVSIDDPKSIEIIDKAIEQVVNQRAKIGTYKNRLEFREETGNQYLINLEQSRSRIKDTNIVDESSKLLKEEIKQNAAMDMLKTNAMNREQVISLLKA